MGKIVKYQNELSCVKLDSIRIYFERIIKIMYCRNVLKNTPKTKYINVEDKHLYDILKRNSIIIAAIKSAIMDIKIKIEEDNIACPIDEE